MFGFILGLYLGLGKKERDEFRRKKEKKEWEDWETYEAMREEMAHVPKQKIPQKKPKRRFYRK